jgi:ABC-type transporter Mla maintaining outer membrane lipid asymmetry permease subunit MlaE
MKVTEQIDCPARFGWCSQSDYLVVPRAVALVVSMPLLVIECVGTGSPRKVVRRR